MTEISIGLDVGTSGVRAVALSLKGKLIAATHEEFPPDATQATGVLVEQNPKLWEMAMWTALRKLSYALSATVEGHEIVGLAVDATSGTFLLLDAANQPLTPGILYSDLRAAKYAEQAQDAVRQKLQPYGITIAPAFALCKIVYLFDREPTLLGRCRRIVHQTDYVVGLLSGRFDVTDISSALKTGADPGSLRWPTELESHLKVPLKHLPRIVSSGEEIASLTSEAAEQSGLPAGIPIVSGCTDGTAGALASGISKPGDVNVTLGTTLVFKAVSETPLSDPAGRIYNHRHPAGGFLPGAASSAGAEWVKKEFPDADLKWLEAEAASRVPSGLCVYPLIGTGERFPFSNPSAVGFGLGDIADPATRYVAGMEGVAYLERLGVQTLEELGLPRTSTTFATGGGTASDLWLHIRASVSRRTLLLPEHPDGAIGAAVLAASPRMGGCRQAQESMVRIKRSVEPDAPLTDRYEEGFQHFCERLRREGYLNR